MFHQKQKHFSDSFAECNLPSGILNKKTNISYPFMRTLTLVGNNNFSENFAYVLNE